MTQANMAQANKLFNGKKLRAVWDKDRKTWWLSVIDIIAALRDTDYDTARNYWKQQKFRMGKNLKEVISSQIKLIGKDGKRRFTDVMRYKDIVLLIQKLPSNTAAGVKRMRKYIGSLATDSPAMLTAFSKAYYEEYKEQIFYENPLLKTTVRSCLFTYPAQLQY